eukprot:1753637-Heterocapsa_arctica.AAC.1
MPDLKLAIASCSFDATAGGRHAVGVALPMLVSSKSNSACRLAESSVSVTMRSCASTLSATAFASLLSARPMAARRPSSCTPAGFIALSCRVKELACSSMCCVGRSAASVASFAVCRAASFTLMAAMAAAVIAADGGEEVA